MAHRHEPEDVNFSVDAVDAAGEKVRLHFQGKPVRLVDLGPVTINPAAVKCLGMSFTAPGNTWIICRSGSEHLVPGQPEEVIAKLVGTDDEAVLAPFRLAWLCEPKL